MLTKLGWEIAGLRSALSAPIKEGAEPAYHAFNCAVTAWHMSDWVWRSATAEDRAELLSKLAAPATGKGSFAAFTGELVKQHRVLHICRQIATGSKHKIIERDPDPDVRAEEQWHAGCRIWSVGGGSITYYVSLMIRDGKIWLPALKVFEEAAQTWDRLLREWGYLEAKLIR
jgi:hypothetical protein